MLSLIRHSISRRRIIRYFKGWSPKIFFPAYAESPSEQEIVSALDTRLRGYDGRAVTFCHTREGGYPEFKTQLGLSR
jgi:hypothetical protein